MTTYLNLWTTDSPSIRWKGNFLCGDGFSLQAALTANGLINVSFFSHGALKGRTAFCTSSKVDETVGSTFISTFSLRSSLTKRRYGPRCWSLVSWKPPHEWSLDMSSRNLISHLMAQQCMTEVSSFLLLFRVYNIIYWKMYPRFTESHENFQDFSGNFKICATQAVCMHVWLGASVTDMIMLRWSDSKVKSQMLEWCIVQISETK